ISMHSGVIEKMQVFCGIPLFKEGMTVEKGQVIITGILRSENENIPTYYHHACGNVVLRICERKTVNVPKKTIKKTPTGRTKNLYKINFKKNNVKFSLNSGISYAEYDKIEKKYKLPFLPITFSKIKYREIDVTTEDTLVSKEIENRRKTFLKELEKKNITTKNLTEDIIENEHYFSVTFIADCLVRADKEIPIREGETNGESS
ncbi:MAG: sporulation protein YqfD, partial [Clostridia bacterium]|nr:sporulation protein YqfD [Clostridia bacterium]